MKRIRKIMATLLAVVMMASVGTSVMAADVEQEGTNGADNMVLVGSYVEEYDDTQIKKELFVNAEQLERGFTGTKYATAVHTHTKNNYNTVVGTITATASFGTQSTANIVYILDKSYYTNINHSSFSFRSPTESTSGSNYTHVKYNVHYGTHWGVTDTEGHDIFVSCDVNGNTSENTATYSLPQPNQVVVGDVTYTF